MLEITTKMEQAINEKEAKVVEINNLCDQLVALEIQEATTRVGILNQLEEKALKEGKKVTDKTKVATADAELEQELNQIKLLKNQIGNLRREIELCNDKISLYRNMIRELEITK